MPRSKQLLLPLAGGKISKEFGGSRTRGHPRGARILSTKHPLHLVLRSSRAKGELSLLSGKRQQKIRLIVAKQARLFHVTLYRYANAGNHLHLLVRAKNRRDFGRFLKAITGLIARLTLKKERGPALTDAFPASKSKRFWDARPYTRVVSWGREFLKVRNYLLMNELEAVGFLPLRNKSLPFTSTA